MLIYIYIYIYRALAFSLLLVIIGFLSTCISIGVSNGSVFAADMPASVYLKPSLTLSIPKSSITLTLDPSSTAFSSDSINIEVGTNNASGYKLYVSTENNNTDLVNTIDNTKTIQTLSTSTPESSFPVNNWGYKLNSGDYLPFTSGALVNSSTGPVNSSATTFTVGAKVDYTKDSGVYQTNLQFNALPTVELHYMQDFATDPTLKDTLCLNGYPTLVTDKRDNKTYYIQRLKDGKCWMIQNLRLGEDLEPVTGSLTLTDQDTDISTTDAYNPRSEFVLTNKITDGRMPGKAVQDSAIGTGTYYIWDGSAFYCTKEYGCYYNFYTASAGVKSEGEDAITTQNTNITTSICPKGWAIPSRSNFINIASAYGYPTDSMATVISRFMVEPTSATENYNGSSAPGFLYGGYYTGGAHDIAKGATYWNRTIYSFSHNYIFSIGSSTFGYNAHFNKYVGGSVRCLLQE